MTDLQMFLKEMGLDKTQQSAVRQEPDSRAVYLVKGYYNDPRNFNGEVPF
tara:strand:- start:347 stop:496 length:150 start_codon:yes stop_codon:yes gene_type:complete